jgi:hypothetical protein
MVNSFESAVADGRRSQRIGASSNRGGRSRVDRSSERPAAGPIGARAGAFQIRIGMMT